MVFIKRLIVASLIVPFLTAMTPFALAVEVVPWMPQAGTMVQLSAKFEPALMVGIQLDAKDPFLFNFLIERGQKELTTDAKREEYRKLVKYFLASLTTPNNDMWVNLSPFEHERIIPDNFGLTEMGRDLLAQDYLLKQITSSLIHPEEGAAKGFWKKVYEKAYEKYGTTDIPLDTFNKVWIVPDTATILHRYDTALIVENHLKVMMEQDYLALEKNEGQNQPGSSQEQPRNETAQLAAEVVREIVIPLLEKEVNEGEHFAPLRQVYSAMLIATWFKKSLKESVLGQVYADRSKVAGVELNDPTVKEQIYQKYLQAYKVGVFNFIKEDVDSFTQEVIPRKYFSGGTKAHDPRKVKEVVLVNELTVSQRTNITKTQENGIDKARVDLRMASRQNIDRGRNNIKAQSSQGAGLSKGTKDSSQLIRLKEANGLRLGDMFNLEEMKTKGAPLVAEREFSANGTTAYIFEKYTYVVWNEGPQAGRVYEIVDHPEEGGNLPSLGQFNAETEERLAALMQIEIKYQEGKITHDVLSAEVGQFFVYLLDAYYGKDGNLGLGEMRLLPVEGSNEVTELFRMMGSQSLDSWLEERLLKMSSGALRKDLMDIGDPILYKEVERYWFSGHDAGLKYFDKEDPLGLSHNAFADSLANIIGAKGLASADSMHGKYLSSFSWIEFKSQHLTTEALRSAIWNALGADLLQAGFSKDNLKQYKTSDGNDLVWLVSLLERNDFFDIWKKKFEHVVALSEKANELEERTRTERQNPDLKWPSEDLKTFNRLLIEMAFPECPRGIKGLGIKQRGGEWDGITVSEHR